MYDLLCVWMGKEFRHILGVRKGQGSDARLLLADSRSPTEGICSSISGPMANVSQSSWYAGSWKMNFLEPAEYLSTVRALNISSYNFGNFSLWGWKGKGRAGTLEQNMPAPGSETRWMIQSGSCFHRQGNPPASLPSPATDRPSTPLMHRDWLITHES